MRRPGLYSVGVLCILVLTGCSVSTGPLMRPSSHPLPPDALHTQLDVLDAGDTIDLHRTDGQVERRIFVEAAAGGLVTRPVPTGSLRTDSYSTISGIRVRQFSPVRSLLAVGAVVAGGFLLAFVIECSEGCFE